jgi:hypothetical protein
MEEESLLSTLHLRIQLQPRVKEGAAEALTIAGAHRGLAHRLASQLVATVVKSGDHRRSLPKRPTECSLPSSGSAGPKFAASFRPDPRTGKFEVAGKEVRALLSKQIFLSVAKAGEIHRSMQIHCL